MEPLDARHAEIAQKLTRLRERMVERELAAVHLRTIPNTGWITGGAGLYVDVATDHAAASIVVTSDRAYVLTNPIEAPRLQDEEALDALGFDFIIEPWYAGGAWLRDLLGRGHVGSDVAGDATVDLEPDLQDLRSHLHAEEVARLRVICAQAAHALDVAIRGVTPGMTEFDAAARSAAASQAWGGQAIVNLVASDDRIARYRHPLPTGKVIAKAVLMGLCMRRQGLIAAISRMVYFGTVPDELRDKARAVAQVDARLILGTQAGRTLGDLFAIAQQAYRDVGDPEAIAQHHQGGSIAYKSREILAQPDDPTILGVHQAFAWNPSVRGAKSEDTVLLGEAGPEILTEIAGWPTWEITVGSQTIKRPAILEL